ncbi:GyrI-like domain-containing protein [Clostridium sp. KNHs205]|uniref:GyrI-like domain-containing protein n=1 Tax=Clostridium sp. KNHs205 TaxID=1449050 RepID=UPI00051BBF15
MEKKVKLDYKKEYKDLYMPKKNPVLIKVPSMNFFMIDGKGIPESDEYHSAMQSLYSFAFTIKMSKMSGNQPPGYFEYVVPPLEGLWSCEDGAFVFAKRDQWIWTSIIRQPEFVTQEVYLNARDEIAKKKPEIDVTKVRFETLEEGLCVQIMHNGPYDQEQSSIDQILRYIEENNLQVDFESGRRHHEIYLSDPRRCKPESLKTVIRYPVKRIR